MSDDEYPKMWQDKCFLLLSQSVVVTIFCAFVLYTIDLYIKYQKNKTCSDKVPTTGIITQDVGQQLIDNTNTESQKWKVSFLDFAFVLISTSY